MTDNTQQDSLKQRAAQAALDHILPQLTKDTVLGIGSGSTTCAFIDLLEPYKHEIAGTVAASEASTARLARHGISVFDLNHVESISFYVDGADETNDQLQLIKGGGAALTREKLIANVAKQFICIADASKQVEVLGTFPLPIEIIAMARTHVCREIEKIGGKAYFRQGVVTDNGNIILDVHGLNITDALALEQQLNHIAGTVCNGLFAMRPADLLLISSQAGVKEYKLNSKR